ncbi:aspartate/glutamate racemase family protein [Marinomonas sp. 15G1-11]|uniref:Aspartate/glutamate racemase family protein n=1 Tax=Marinomonas phaeophyticola TaxID=3004091 RepID=A0ABT4JT41_9GAMM|nr:aspartate/glutamate racemase family protein [Marinomonas sp. 15G1-11]MCZ2721489.1 aspartate/glutamate racemase family protein [Marinomonas sp. 15G1-11]
MKKISKPFSLGVLMLNTHFPRVMGDIGNPDSFAFNVLYERVSSAKVSAIVTSEGVHSDIKKDIFESIKSLENKGVDLIVTTCGFLGEMQDELKKSTNVPILTSSLLTLPFVRTFINKENDKVGVLTFDAKKLNEKHFGGHYKNDVVIGDIPKDGELYKTIKNDYLSLDVVKSEEEVVSSALKLIENNKNIKAIVLECTNLSPYIDAVKTATNLPVFDIIQAINWFRETKSI